MESAWRIGELMRVRSPTSDDKAATVAVTALWAVFPLLPLLGVAVVSLAIALLTAVAYWRRMAHAAALGVFCTACFVAMLCGAQFSQIWLAVGLAACVAVARIVPWMADVGAWLHAGTFGRDIQALCVGSVAIAAAALLLWFAVLRPNVADLIAQFFPPVAPFWILTGGVLFAAVNAALEEGAYRGVVMWALEGHVGKSAALLMQAVAFGTLHINGFPRGAVGVALACIYGLMMGGIRLRAGGLLAPWAAHVCVDVVIVAIIVGLAR